MKTTVRLVTVITSALALHAVPAIAAEQTPKAAPPPPKATAAPATKPVPQSSAPAAKPPSGSPEPVWPAPFDLLEGDLAGWRLVVGQPGPINVSVRSKGAAITVTLRRPDGAVLERSGTGEIALAASATAADVQRGVLWSLSVHGAAPPPSRDGKARRLAPVASGTVAVTHPPGDSARAEAEVKALAAQAQAHRAQNEARARAAPPVDLAARRRVELVQQNTARQAQMLAQLRSQIPADAFQRAQSRIQSGAAASGKPSAPLTSRAAPSAVPHGALATTPSTPMHVQSLTASGPPAIGSLSVAEGQPGDPVLVTGTAFGDEPGTLHFIVASGKDLVAPLTFWSNGQIMAEVPYLDGVRDFNGQTYVTRSDGSRSGLQPFRFNPPLDAYALHLPVRGSKLFDSSPNIPWNPSFQVQFVYGNPELFGSKGDHEFYLQSRLANGWVVESVTMVYGNDPGIYVYGNAFASVVDIRPGTDSPYVKVHWWKDAFSEFIYGLHIDIRGPRCLPPVNPNPFTNDPPYSCAPHIP